MSRSIFVLLFLAFILVPALCFAEDLCKENREHSFMHEGKFRRYEVYLPKSYSTKKKYPVVLLLHGGGGSARGMCITAQYHRIADKEKIIVVYPEGAQKQKGKKKFHLWNSGNCGAIDIPATDDDVGYFRKLLKSLKSHYSVQEQMISAAGLSNGGMMVYRLACELSKEISAIVPVGAPGPAVCGCNARRTVPTFLVHGTEDPCAALKGGDCIACMQTFARRLVGIKQPKVRECPNVLAGFKDWRTNFGSDMPLMSSKMRGDANCRRSSDGKFQQCIFDGGHVWPTPYSLHGIMCSSESPYRKRACDLFGEVTGEFPISFDVNEELTRFVKQFQTPQ